MEEGEIYSLIPKKKEKVLWRNYLCHLDQICYLSLCSAHDPNSYQINYNYYFHCVTESNTPYLRKNINCIKFYKIETLLIYKVEKLSKIVFSIYLKYHCQHHCFKMRQHDHIYGPLVLMQCDAAYIRVCIRIFNNTHYFLKY
jgi:hypothetical protein